MIFPWLVVLGCCFAEAESQLVYKLNKIECLVNKTRVKNVSCHVKAISWNMAVVNMDCFMIFPLYPEVRMQVFVKDYSNQYKPFLIDVAIKMCEVIQKRNFISYGVIIWKLFKRFTNVNHTCPFSGQLSARNGYLDTSLLPPFPHGSYLVSLTIVDSSSANKEYVGTIKFFLQSMELIKSKKAAKALV
ncbi:uncharacterized protein LOC108094195 [Drosophila ficusphila]|uniref:uncharacterized protein LOC108094195 n=1 Tax=Drosophila ficusphila TaxID=30025 RepID=UPI001C8AEDD0|nr:uncharacterized protein LOC108094195 [Drosophila ficusphila]